MTTVERTFSVNLAPDAVVDYLKDFANAEEWDPGTERCVRTDDGPIRVGSTWHNTSKIAGVTTELTYTLDELSADTVVFAGKNDSANEACCVDKVTSPTTPNAGHDVDQTTRPLGTAGLWDIGAHEVQ